MIPESDSHRAFGNIRPAVVAPIRENLTYAMLYGGRDMAGPNIPPPVPRQSLAQRILIARHQASLYISKLTRDMSPLPEIGYPAARALTLIRTTPPQNTQPTSSRYGSAAAGGVMRPSPRFVKALPYPTVPYVPPTY